MELEAISKPAIPDPRNDDPAWEKCRPPLWPRRTIDGGWTNIPSDQTWRRKVNGKWQYKRDEKLRRHDREHVSLHRALASSLSSAAT